MKDYLKNPNFYYIAIPVITAVWAVYAWSMSLPGAQEKFDKYRGIWQGTQTQIARILKIDSDRLDYEKLKGSSKEFDYATVMDRFTTLAKIPESRYSLTGRGIKKVRGRKVSSADVKINDINIEKLAVFLTSMLQPWPDLQCEQLNLTKQKSGPDVWDVTMKFTYYY